MQGNVNEYLSYLHKFLLILNIWQGKKVLPRKLDLQEASA